MKNATVLFLANGETPDSAISSFAQALGETNTHLSCLLLDPTPQLPVASIGVLPYGSFDVPDEWFAEVEQAHQRQNKRLQEIETLLAGLQISADVQAAVSVESELKHHVAHKARVSDYACIAGNLRQTPQFREAAAGVLFHSPIGLMLNCDVPRVPETIFIAWDSSKAASRAVHAALPMLKGSTEVVIGCFDPLATAAADGTNPGSGLATWLSHHGCRVTVNQYPSGGKEIAECIQDRAREVGADLVVMGAYGHSRIVQAVFGGTSRSMMRQSELTVFLAS